MEFVTGPERLVSTGATAGYGSPATRARGLWATAASGSVFAPIPAPAMDDSAPPSPIDSAAGAGSAEVLAAIRGHVALVFRDGRRDGLDADTPLVSSGIVDSAGVLHLVDWLEERFAIRLEDDDVTPEHFDSLRALADLVIRRGGRA